MICLARSSLVTWRAEENDGRFCRVPALCYKGWAAGLVGNFSRGLAARGIRVRETSDVVHKVPDLIVGQRLPESRHSRVSVPVPDDPKQFRIGPLLHFRARKAGHARVHRLANVGGGFSVLPMAERAIPVKCHPSGGHARGIVRGFRDVLPANFSRDDPAPAHRGHASLESRGSGNGAQIKLSDHYHGNYDEEK
jgi:hypothetical protein